MVKVLFRRPAKRASPPHSQGKWGPRSSDRSALSLPSDGLPHDLQRHTSGFNLNHLEVDVIERTIADQPLDLGLDLLRDRRVETPFFPLRSACSRPAAHRRSGR